MAERCKYAYRQRGSKAVYCKQVRGDNPYCAFQQMCYKSNRFEATSSSGVCSMRSKPPVQDE